MSHRDSPTGTEVVGREPSAPRSGSRGADGFSPSPPPSSPSAYAPSNPGWLSPSCTSPSPSPSDPPPPRGENPPSPDGHVFAPAVGPEPARGASQRDSPTTRAGAERGANSFPSKAASQPASLLGNERASTEKAARPLFVAATQVEASAGRAMAGIGGYWPDIGSMSLTGNMNLRHRRPTIEEPSPSVSPSPTPTGILSRKMSEMSPQYW